MSIANCYIKLISAAALIWKRNLNAKTKTWWFIACDMIVCWNVEWQPITIEISMNFALKYTKKWFADKIQVSFIDRDYICTSRAIYKWSNKMQMFAAQPNQRDSIHLTNQKRQFRWWRQSRNGNLADRKWHGHSCDFLCWKKCFRCVKSHNNLHICCLTFIKIKSSEYLWSLDCNSLDCNNW